MDALPDPGWRRLAVAPALAILVAMLLLVLAGWLVDLSPLQQGGDSSGHLAAATLVALLLGLVPMLLAALLAVVAPVVEHPAAWVWVASGVAAVSGTALALLGLNVVLRGSEAGTVFGLVALLLGFGLLAPVALCLRERRRTA